MKKQIAAGVLSLSMVLTPTIPVWAQTPVVVAQDQTTEFTFATTIITNAKADQEAPAAAPELQEKTASTVTLKPLSEGTTGKQAEYARFEGTADLVWQESNVFSDLTPNTKYAFVVRYKETAEFNASPASAPLEVTTAKRSTSYGGGGGAAPCLSAGLRRPDLSRALRAAQGRLRRRPCPQLYAGGGADTGGLP